MPRIGAIALTTTLLGALLVCAPARAEDPAAPPPAPKPMHADAPVRITLADGARALRVTRMVAAPIDTVWKTWASSEGLSTALGTPVTVEPKLGGKFEIQWVPDAPEGQRGSEGCTVQAWLPSRMLAFTWNAPPQFGDLRNQHSLVVIEMEEVCHGITQVRLTHHGFGEGEDWTSVYDYFTQAWPRVMDRVCASLGGALPTAQCGKQGWVYLITDIYRDRDDFIRNMTDEEKSVMAEHSRYLSDKTRAGEVIQAGPCTDMQGPGIVIFYAPSEEAARAFMENDPAVKHGIFITELHPLALSLLRERDRITP